MMVYFMKSDQISKKKKLQDSIIEKKLKSRMGVKAIGFGSPSFPEKFISIHTECNSSPVKQDEGYFSVHTCRIVN